MNSAVVLALIALLTAHVDDVAASCRKVPNDDMLEYLCEGGHPGDLATVPETTEKLRISRMPLRRITDDTFAKFGDKLWVLSCSHCEISEIEVNAFRRLVNLQQLSLDNNYLTVVKASWFEGLDSLTYLDINYNDIREIENGVYQNLPALVDFRISGNRLRCLNLDEMSYLRQLKRMFLGENPEFACPHAVSEFLENQHVTFERDPEWKKLVHDAVEVHVPPVHAEKKHEEHEIDVPPHRGQLYPDSRPPQQPGAPVAPPLTGDRPFHSAEHYGRRRRPMTTTTSTTTMRPIMSQSHVPRVEPIPAPGNMRDSHKELPVQTPGSSRPMLFYPYPTPETPRAPLQESKPPLENARMTAEADRPPLTEDVSYPSYVPTRHGTSPSYPIYVTSEKSQAPSEESRPFPENIRFMPGTNWSLPTEYDLYPAYKPTHEILTSSYPSYTTSEGSRGPLIESRIPSEDITASTARSNRPMLTEHTVTYPPHEPTRETMSYPYPYVTSEGSRGPLIESRIPSEDTTASTARPDRPMLTEHAVTYPPHEPTRETMSYPYPYVTSEGSRGPLIESRIPSQDTTASTARPDRPMLTEHTVTYPPHEPTRETMSYPYPYVTSEKSPILVAGTEASSENEMTTWTTGVSSSHPPQEIVYPLYVATPDGREKMSHGSIQISRPWSTSDPDAFVTSRTSWTDDSMQHRPDDWSQDGARHEQRLSSLTTNAPTGRQETPYHVSRESTGRGYTINVEEWSSSTDGFFVATDLPVERDNKDADKEKLHYVRPLSHSVATDESHDDDKAAIGMETTTDKPLPDCSKKNSAPRARPASVLVMSIVVVIFGHVIVAGF